MEELEQKFVEVSLEESRRQDEAKEKAKKLLNLVREGLDYAKKRTPQLTENMAFYQNNLSLLKQYKENRPWVIQMNTPYASVDIDKRVASIIANDYIGELIAYRQEDVEKIRTLQDLYVDEWERMEMDRHVDKAISKSAVVREGYVHVYFDKTKKYGGRKGVLCANELDTNTVILDPRARDFHDVLWVAVLGRITKEDAEERYPDYEKFFTTNVNTVPEERGENYVENDYTSQQEGVLTVYTIFRKEKGKIRQYIIVDDMLVAEKTLDGLKRIPIAQMRWKEAAQSAYGMALMDDVLTLQKAVSSMESAITNTAISFASPSIIVRKGSGLNPAVVARTTGAPGTVFETNLPIGESLQVISPGKIDDRILNLKINYEQAISKICGVSDQFSGDIGTAGNTSGGAKLAVERAKIIEANVINNITVFVQDLTMIVMDYVSSLYAGEVVTTRKTDESTGQTTFTPKAVPEDADKLEFSYFINLNMKTSYNKERERDAFINIYQMERQYDAPVKLITELDILETYDLSNKDALRQRYKDLQANSAEQKAKVIASIMAASQKFQIDPQLTQAAITDVIRGDKNRQALDQFTQMAQQSAQMMEQEMQSSADDLIAQGMDPQDVQAAQAQMTEQGQQPSMQDLNLI